MNNTTKPTFLERMIRALAMATPWCMGLRYKDLAHCVEASVGGAGALKKRGIEARPLPCAFIGYNPNLGAGGFGHAIGHNARSMYEWMRKQNDGPAPTFDEWMAEQVAAGGGIFPETEAPLHMAIEAKHCGKRALLDLTVGQVREASGGRIPAPNILVHYGNDWPCFDLGDGVTLAYGPSPYREKTRAAWRDYKCPGLVGDMYDLMGVALKCDLDHEKFTEKMMRLAQSGGFVPAPQ